jgi:hypothetical protein
MQCCGCRTQTQITLGESFRGQLDNQCLLMWPEIPEALDDSFIIFKDASPQLGTLCIESGNVHQM